MAGRGSIPSTAKLALVLLLILGSILSTCNAKISDKRLCYDEDCSVVVSEGRTVIPYNSKDQDVLSFPLNAEVKIYSKAAGKRTDLWGVEIRGKRGYAPSKFIREHRILHSKLNYTVPTEESYNKDSKNVVHATKNLKEINEEINHVVSNKEKDNNQTTISEDVPKENLEINPHQVSPSYDIYDGTVIPKEYEEVEQPNYSTQTVQASVKEEEVQLNVYPNLLKSTFSAIKGMLSNTDENSKEIFDIVSAEKVINDETVEKATETKETDKSSFTSEEKQNEIKKDTASEDIPEDVTEEKKLQEYENINNNEINSSTPPEVTGTVSEKKINEEDSAIKSSKEAANVEIVDESNENKEEVIDPIDSVQQVDVEKPVEVRADKISKTNTIDEVESVSDSLQNDVVPKQEETETVTNNNSGSIENALGAESVPVAAAEERILDRQEVDVNATSVNSPIVSDSNENISGAENVVVASVEETILDKQEVDVNATSVDSKNVEDSITPEVPLKQEVEEESVAMPKEPFLPEENSFQPNLSKNESTPIQNDIETDDNLTTSNVFVEKTNVINNSLNLKDQLEIHNNIGDSNNNVIDDSIYTTSRPTNLNVSAVEDLDSSLKSTDSIQEPTVDIPATSSFGEFLGNRNLLNTEQESEEIEVAKVNIDETIQTTTAPDSDENISSKVNQEEESTSYQEALPSSNVEKIVLPPETCDKMYDCSSEYAGHKYYANENAVTNDRKPAHSSETLLYVCITAVTTLLFSLGYYFIENKRRDAYLIGKINNLEKDLMITRKECIMLDENFKSTKTKLDSIEDESFGSNEMVLSLKAELVASETTRAELEEQIASLEKELESTSEAGLELERMLREILSSHSEENNPLAQSIEDLQDRLNNQQIANESLTNALAARTQEKETLTGDLTVSLKKVEQLQAEVTKLSHELKTQMNAKIELEQTLSDQVQRLELQVKSIAEDKSHLRKQLKLKELEVKELLTVVEQINLNNLDFEKLYEVSQIKAEAAHLLEERNELKIKLSEEEGAHQLLEEHVKLVKEEVSLLSEQCKLAEKEKKDAETRLEVLTRFFEEKEAQRQKEEAVWLEKQGEVSSTVERIQTMQTEILNYKQQIEMLKREILDQEREYKNQISTLETKAHEHWVAARQHERRLEEIKVESSQLRNRLTIVEKNINDGDPEIKLHRLQGANGDESSSSPLMFAGSGPPPLPPPSYLYGSPGSFAPPPPFLPPPLSGPGELVGSRPPPLGGGRLSSPPPTGPSGNATSGGHNPAGSPPPLSPPPPLMPYLTHHHIRDHHQHHPLHRRRSPPPLPPFEVPPPPLPLHHHHHMPPPPPGSGWGDEPLPPLRNSSGFQLHQRDQRARNHKDSLHSSGESLDKSHHGGKA